MREMDTLQLINGELRLVEEGCRSYAKKTFRKWTGDTNPRVVQMVRQGRPISHHYFRSDQ